MFFIIDKYFSTKFENYLAVHEKPEHITFVRTYRSSWIVLYIETVFFFPLIDKLVCTIQSNQTLDEFIKNVA